MTAVTKSINPLLTPIIRTPAVGGASAEVVDSAPVKKVGLRPQETFSRSVITFRSDRGGTKDRGPIGGGPIKGTYSSSFAKRADRRSLRLLGFAVVIMLVLIATFMVRSHMRNHVSRILANNTTDVTAPVAISNLDVDQMEISTKDQNSSMNEKIGKARASKEAAAAVQNEAVIDVAK
jgi:hypothetical protein